MGEIELVGEVEAACSHSKPYFITKECPPFHWTFIEGGKQIRKLVENFCQVDVGAGR